MLNQIQGVGQKRLYLSIILLKSKNPGFRRKLIVPEIEQGGTGLERKGKIDFNEES